MLSGSIKGQLITLSLCIYLINSNQPIIYSVAFQVAIFFLITYLYSLPNIQEKSLGC